MSNATEEETAITSIRQLAKAVGKSPTAVAGRLRHAEWPFDTVPPWSPEDVEEMRAWARQTLKPDYAAEERDDDGFYAAWGWLGTVRVRVGWADGSGDKHEDALKEGPELCTVFERAVISGKRTPTPAQVRLYIARTVRLKALLLDDQRMLAGWLAGRPVKEIERRMHTAACERLAWFAQTFHTAAESKRLGIFSSTSDD